MPITTTSKVTIIRRGNIANDPAPMMTAAENARRWADEIGADAFLAKPFALDDLLGIVQRFEKDRRD